MRGCGLRSLRRVGVLGCALLVVSFATADDREPVLHRIAIDGPISPATVDYVETAVARANEEATAALIIRLEPGGVRRHYECIHRSLVAGA